MYDIIHLLFFLKKKEGCIFIAPFHSAILLHITFISTVSGSYLKKKKKKKNKPRHGCVHDQLLLIYTMIFVFHDH